MKKIFTNAIILFICGVLLAGCKEKQQDTSALEEAALNAYASFLLGDRTLLNEVEREKWYLPDFQDEGAKYEYTYLDLDGDHVVELIIQMAGDPCGYNAVFHFEDGRLFCWNSDAMEMSCRDYLLNDGTMARQYDYNGACSYTLFRYLDNGQTEDIASMFSREELVPEDSLAPCPYYEIDGKEVEKAVFDEMLTSLMTDRILTGAAWKRI